MSVSNHLVMTRRTLAMSATMLIAPIAARAATEQQELVARAHTTLESARHDPQFGSAADFFSRARAIMVVPQLVKGGFFIGGEGGNGVLLQRGADGTWGSPLFYGLGAVSLGLQIGLEVAEVVMFVMSDKALRAWTTNEVKLGAQAGLTVLVVGSNAAAAATTAGNVDVIAWAKSKGAYAGITLEGSVIKPRDDWNTAFYGHPVVPAKMLKIG
jgi:lipid-binding SYLF domain-containing protein